jgi:hypothetical protein
MDQIGSTTVKRTTAKSRRYIYPHIPLPPQYASLVGSQVEMWENGNNEITLRFGKSCHALNLILKSLFIFLIPRALYPELLLLENNKYELTIKGMWWKDECRKCAYKMVANFNCFTFYNCNPHIIWGIVTV